MLLCFGFKHEVPDCKICDALLCLMLFTMSRFNSISQKNESSSAVWGRGCLLALNTEGQNTHYIWHMLGQECLTQYIVKHRSCMITLKTFLNAFISLQGSKYCEEGEVSCFLPMPFSQVETAEGTVCPFLGWTYLPQTLLSWLWIQKLPQRSHHCGMGKIREDPSTVEVSNPSCLQETDSWRFSTKISIYPPRSWGN